MRLLELSCQASLAGVVLAFVASCGGSSSQTGVSSTTAHTALPQVEANGGTILTAIEVVTVTFDPSLYTNVTSPTPTQLVLDLQSFGDTITQSSWWDTVRAGYCSPVGSTNCIGRGTTLPAAQGHVELTTAPAASYTDSAQGGPATLKTYIAGLLSAGTLPAPTANTLYVFYFPSSTTITSDGQASCDVFGGYHNSLTYDGADVPYAIVPVCDPETTAQGTAELTHEQTVTFAASHELIESASDPHVAQAAPTSSPYEYLGFYLTDSASQAWNIVLGGGEIADLCVDQAGVGEDRWTEATWTVQRVWNNVSAAGDHDPCVPVPAGEVYFNVAPPLSDEQIQLLTLNQSASFSGVSFSDGDAPAWNVELVDLGHGILTTSPTTTNRATTIAGESVPLQVTLTSALQSPIQGDPPFEPFAIVSIGTGTTYHLWPGLVFGSQ